MFRLITGIPGPSGFGSASTAEQVTQGIDASNLTAIVTGDEPRSYPVDTLKKRIFFFVVALFIIAIAYHFTAY